MAKPQLTLCMPKMMQILKFREGDVVRTNKEHKGK